MTGRTAQAHFVGAESAIGLRHVVGRLSVLEFARDEPIILRKWHCSCPLASLRCTGYARCDTRPYNRGVIAWGGFESRCIPCFRKSIILIGRGNSVPTGTLDKLRSHACFIDIGPTYYRSPLCAQAALVLLRLRSVLGIGFDSA